MDPQQMEVQTKSLDSWLAGVASPPGAADDPTPRLCHHEKTPAPCSAPGTLSLSKYKKEYVRAGEVAQWVRALLLKHKDVSSNPRHSCKKPGMAACVSRTLMLYRTDRGRWLGRAILALGSERPCLKGLEQRDGTEHSVFSFGFHSHTRVFTLAQRHI